jgi:acetyltransferase-like isoleucine patch superfamily enzyme
MLSKARSGLYWLRALITFRRAGLQPGPRPQQRGRLRLKITGDARIGKGFLCHGSPGKLVGITVQRGATFRLGDNAFMNHGSGVLCTKHVEIGDNIKVGPDVVIRDSDAHEISPGRGVRRKSIIIGDNVWLGQRVIVLPGARIGDNAVIAAGAIVSGEIPANCIAGGVPAKIIDAFDAPPPGWVRK